MAELTGLETLSEEEKRKLLGLDPLDADGKEDDAVVASKPSYGDKRPLSSFQTDNPVGSLISETGKVAANAGIGIVTDAFDVVAGLQDIGTNAAKQILSPFTKEEIDWEGTTFNDADNPWTQWRREALQADTQLGQSAATLARIATIVPLLPKTGGKLLGKGLGFLAGKAFKSRKGVQKGLLKAKEGVDYLAYGQQAKVAGAKAAKKLFPKSSSPKKALDIVENTPEINQTLRRVTENISEAEQLAFTQKVGRRLKTLGLATVERYKPKNILHTISNDVLAGFMVAGEGDIQLDETMTDLARELGVPYAPWLATNIEEDSAMTLKLKQALDGTLFSAVLSPLVDMTTIWRYSRRLKNAAPAARKTIMKSFDNQAEELAVSVIKVNDREFVDQAANLTMNLDGTYSMSGDVTGTSAPDLNPLRYGRQFGEQWGADPNIDPFDPSAIELRSRVMPNEPRQGFDINDGPLQASNVLDGGTYGPNRPAARVSPQSLRLAFDKQMTDAFLKARDLDLYEVSPGVFAESKASIKRLMPSNRKEALDFLLSNPIAFNPVGVVKASDSVWSNAIVNRGISEGWIKIDENFEYLLNRKIASDLDIGDANIRAADKLDEAVNLEMFDDGVPFSPSRLPQEEAVNDAALNVDEANRLGFGSEAQPTRQTQTLAEPPAVDAPKAEAPAAPAPQAQKIAAEAEAINPEDQELIRQMLGLSAEDIENVTGVVIEKAQGTRKLVVRGPDGEELGTFTRKSEAQKFAKKEIRNITDDLLDRARGLADEAADQPFDIAQLDDIPRSSRPLKGALKLTKQQKALLSTYSDELADVLNKDTNRLNFDFDYYSMQEFTQGLEQMLLAGKVSGNNKRVIRNIIDKMKLQQQQLDPIARARARVDDLLSNTRRGVEHGDFC